MSAGQPLQIRVRDELEVEDDEGFWFPTRVLAVRDAEVLVTYYGFKQADDEWLPHTSTRLRKHRGWGTARQPGDYQLGTFVMALDLDNKWCKAKILCAASHAYKVHYQAWSSNWDEWIDRLHGRLRALAPKDPQAPKARGTKRAAPAGRKRPSGHDEVCACCELVGDEFLCCNSGCLRSFHVDCLPSSHPPPKQSQSRWRCADCTRGRFRCFVCKEWAARADLRACAHRASGKASCGKLYHNACLMASLERFQHARPAARRGDDVGAASPSAPSRGDSSSSEHEAGGSTDTCRGLAECGGAAVLCARHWCVICKETESSGYGKAMQRCIRCCTASHVHCAQSAPGGAPAPFLISQSTILCQRCFNLAPKGLNAPGWGKPAGRRPSSVAAVSGHASVAPSINRTARPGANATTPAVVSHTAAATTERAVAPGQTNRALSRGWVTAAGLPPAGSWVEMELPIDILAELRAQAIVPSVPTGFGPKPYTVLRRSIYVHAGPREQLPLSDVTPCLCSVEDGGCDSGCLNRSEQQECNPATCPCGQLCANRQLSTQAEGGVPPVQVFLTENKGWGVKATREIQAGEFVIEYVGEVIDCDAWEVSTGYIDMFRCIYISRCIAVAIYIYIYIYGRGD